MDVPLIRITLGRVARASSDEPPFTDPPQFFRPADEVLQIIWYAVPAVHQAVSVYLPCSGSILRECWLGFMVMHRFDALNFRRLEGVSSTHATERAESAAWAWIVVANWLPPDDSKILKEVTMIVFSPSFCLYEVHTNSCCFKWFLISEIFDRVLLTAYTKRSGRKIANPITKNI
jgi:hypothetical protein